MILLMSYPIIQHTALRRARTQIKPPKHKSSEIQIGEHIVNTLSLGQKPSLQMSSVRRWKKKGTKEKQKEKNVRPSENGGVERKPVEVHLPK